MMKLKITILLLGMMAITGSRATAQNVAVKTNLLYWATTTPNLGLEFGLGGRTTLDVTGTYNPFTFSNDKKLKNAFVQPEFRLWNCEKFNRSFWGFHGIGGIYNASKIDLPLQIFPSLKNHRIEGWMVGGGVSYGYQWYLGPHWNLEATFGFGYIYFEYDRFECGECMPKLGSSHKHYFGPTKIGVSFVYLFKSKK